MDYIYNNLGKMIELNMEMIPLDKFNCYVLNMKLNKSINLYQNEISVIFEFFSKLKYHVIFFDELMLNHDGILMLDSITKLVNEDILIMTSMINC